MKNLTIEKEMAVVRSIIVSKKNYFMNLSYIFKDIEGNFSKIRTIKEKSFVVSTSEKQAKQIKKAIVIGLFNIVNVNKTVSGYSGLLEVFTSKKNYFEFDLINVEGMYKINIEYSKKVKKEKEKSFDARSVR